MTKELNNSEEVQQEVEQEQITDNISDVENPENFENHESSEVFETPEFSEQPEDSQTSESTEILENLEKPEISEDFEHKDDVQESEKSKRFSVEAPSVIVPNTDDFNWDELGKDKQQYSHEDQKQMEDVYNQTFSSIVEQEVVMGTIVAKNAREVVVNIGFKSDGVLAANELRYLEDLKIGDKIEVYVECQEDASGQL
jgi:small subunit ribosomal protein S1